MDLMTLTRVNDLWNKVYPYLAAQVWEAYGRSGGEVLELGPFSGGISAALARLHPRVRITIAAQDPAVVDYLRTQMESAGLNQKTKVLCSELDRLGFSERQFDMVLFRGAYFFLDEEGKILRETHRVLRGNGLAFLGGGYGKNTPQALIDEIAGESRELNDRLGRRRVTEHQIEQMARKSGLTREVAIEKRGGLWLVIRK